MKFELFIANRLKFKSDNSGKTSPSITIAVAGIALAIIIMMIAIVVVLGFKQQIRDKVMGFDAQITIKPWANEDNKNANAFVNFNDTLKSIITDIIPEAEISLAIKQPAILKTDDNFLGIILKGMDSNHDWKFVSDNIIKGHIPQYNNNGAKQDSIIISKSIADRLNLDVGDKVYTYFFIDNNVRTRRYSIAALYESHFGEYDNMMAFTSINTLQRLNSIPATSGNQIEIRNLYNDKIENCTRHIQDRLYIENYTGNLPRLYQAENVFYTGAIYFNWLNLLDTNVVVLLILMTIVSGFTLISSMFVIMLERVKMIGILKSHGATDKQIRLIFIHLAQRLVFKGMFIGNIIALSVILLQYHFHILPLDPESYYLSSVPVEINWIHIVLLNISVILISYLILVFPSKLIAKISPSKTIRYE